MPKFNADEYEFEPIEVVLGGKTYSIDSVSQSMFDRMKLSGKEAKESLDKGEENINVVYEQLGIILNEEPEVFIDIDLRKATATIRFLTETIIGQVEGPEKNDSGED